jgi:hypothetical protein
VPATVKECTEDVTLVSVRVVSQHTLGVLLDLQHLMDRMLMKTSTIP